MLRGRGAGCPLCPGPALAAGDGSGQTASQPVTVAESRPQSTVERTSSPTGTSLSFYLSVCLKTQVSSPKCDAAPSRRHGHPGRSPGGGSHTGMRTPKPLCSPPISESPTNMLLSGHPPHPSRSCFDHILAGSSILTAKLHMRTGASCQPFPLWLESLTCRTGYCPPPPLLRETPRPQNL